MLVSLHPPNFRASLSPSTLIPDSFPGFSKFVWRYIFTFIFLFLHFLLTLEQRKKGGGMHKTQKYSFLVYQRQPVYSEGQSSSFSWRISIPRPLGEYAVEENHGLKTFAFCWNLTCFSPGYFPSCTLLLPAPLNSTWWAFLTVDFSNFRTGQSFNFSLFTCLNKCLEYMFVLILAIC